MRKLGGHWSERVPPTGGHATPDERPSAEPGVLWGTALDGTAWRALFQVLGEEGRPGGLQLGPGSGTLFPCEGRGRCGLPCRLSRTSAWTRADAKAP